MAEILNQNEIDALLSAVSNGEVETEHKTETKKEGADFISYNLASSEKIYKGRYLAIHAIHDRLARLLRISFSQLLKKNITVTCTNTDYLKFGEYLSNITLPCSLAVYGIENLNGHLIMHANSKLTYMLVDSYYGGGSGLFTKDKQNGFTLIEEKMNKKVFELCQKDIMEAWRLNYPLKLNFLKNESNPHFVGSIHVGELVAVISFEITMDKFSSPLHLVLQIKSLEPIHTQLSVAVTSELPMDTFLWEEHWKNELLNLYFNIHVEVGHCSKNLTEIQNLKIGDTLLLDEDALSELPIYVEKIKKFNGVMGQHRGSKAIKVLSRSETTI